MTFKPIEAESKHMTITECGIILGFEGDDGYRFRRLLEKNGRADIVFYKDFLSLSGLLHKRFVSYLDGHAPSRVNSMQTI